MGDILVVCGLGIFAVFTVCMIREIRRELTVPLILTVCVVFLCSIIPKIEPAVSLIGEFSAVADGEYIGCVLRALGITYITSVSSDICKSAGESAVAGYVETAGRAEIILLCIPLMRELLGVVML